MPTVIAEGIKLRTYANPTGLAVAVSNLPDVTGTAWERHAKLRALACAAITQAFPQFVIVGTAATSDHSLIVSVERL
jgi:hypothetical protein